MALRQKAGAFRNSPQWEEEKVIDWSDYPNFTEAARLVVHLKESDMGTQTVIEKDNGFIHPEQWIGGDGP